MKMKALTTLTLTCILLSVSALIIPVFAVDQPTVGVKPGDWIEYSIHMTGQTEAPNKNMTWFRMDVLDMEEMAFQVNVTIRAINGTLRSSVWAFNFTEGNFGGCLIIPANLNPGETFYDAWKLENVIIEGEQQKLVAGANRTITHACDSKRIIKEWDKETGVYTHAVERSKNYTIITSAVATNLWIPQNTATKETSNTLLAVCIALATAVLLLLLVVIHKPRINRQPLSSGAQKKIAALIILAVVLFEVGTIFFFPFYDVSLTFAEINLIMQTIWTGMVLASLWFRSKGNYFVHELLMLMVICAWAVGLTAVLFMDPFSTSTDVFSNTPLRLIMNVLHGVFSVPALVFGVWLVALWRPNSQIFPVKSRKLAQLLPIFWLTSYVVGVLDFLLLHTTIFS
jgi:hypothetical protein